MAKENQVIVLGPGAQRPQNSALPLTSGGGPAAKIVVTTMIERDWLQGSMPTLGAMSRSRARPVTGMSPRWLPRMTAPNAGCSALNRIDHSSCRCPLGERGRIWSNLVAGIRKVGSRRAAFCQLSLSGPAPQITERS